MTKASSPVCPFAVGDQITDRRAFVGRRDEIEFIVSSIQGDQPTSVTIVGDRKIGKSSLLYHIFQTYEDRVNQVDRFVVIYLSLKQANCRDRDSFYQAVADEFLKLPKVQNRPELVAPLLVSPFESIAFEKAWKDWKAAGVLPVICLDDFEELLDRTDRFNDDFYDNLRSLIGNNILMLAIAARKKLMIYSQQKKLTSDFFNVFQNKVLREFTNEDSSKLVQLPDINQPALGEDKRLLAIKWGENHPCRLQIAARCLWDARQGDRSEAWARRQFEERVDGVPRKFQPIKLALHFVMRLGRFGQAVGDNVEDWGSFVKGMFIICLVIAFLSGAAKWSQINDWFQDTQKEVKEKFK